MSFNLVIMLITCWYGNGTFRNVNNIVNKCYNFSCKHELYARVIFVHAIGGQLHSKISLNLWQHFSSTKLYSYMITWQAEHCGCFSEWLGCSVCLIVLLLTISHFTVHSVPIRDMVEEQQPVKVNRREADLQSAAEWHNDRLLKWRYLFITS